MQYYLPVYNFKINQLRFQLYQIYKNLIQYYYLCLQKQQYYR
nr:MAG TPA: hypothetical protein [Caudoviricetes sp.]